MGEKQARIENCQSTNQSGLCGQLKDVLQPKKNV